MDPLDLDPRLDLLLERRIPVSPERVWAAWTTPSLLEQWFCPKPWRAADWKLDLRPGGACDCTMYGPDGEVNPMRGVYLEVVPHRRLVWTDALTAGFRPSASPFFTGMILLAPDGAGSWYRAVARHGTEEGAQQHAAMGFHVGWGLALDQLVALMGTGGA